MRKKKKSKDIDPLREDVSLDEVMGRINKKFGEKTMILGSQRPKDPPRLPFGVFLADFVTGGGIPIWQTVCGWGADSSGKTLLGIKAMRSAALMCWKCFHPKIYCKCPGKKALSMKSVYLGAEGMLDKIWAKDCGVDPESFIETNCDFGEQYIDVADESLKSQECGLIIFDSLAALVPEAEMEASASDQFIGKQASMIGRAVRRLKTRLLMEMKKDHPCTIYFINQMRSKIGVMFGSPDWMPGGWAMRHEFSLLLKLVKKSLAKGKEGKKGADDAYFDGERAKEQASRHSFEIKKEKVLTLAGSGEFVIIKENLENLGLRRGMVDDFNVMMRMAEEYEVVKKDSKGWKYFNFNAKTHDNIKNVWRENPSEYIRCTQEIVKRAKERLKGNGKGSARETD